MFGFNKKSESQEESLPQSTEEEQTPKKGMFSRLKAGLTKTRNHLTKGLSHLFLGKKVIDEDLLEEIESLLLTSDIGVEVTQILLDEVRDQVSRQYLKEPQALFQALKENMINILEPVEEPLTLPTDQSQPFVILMVGVNGAGKTTTIGKLAKRFQSEGLSVMLAAGDTFRAAAVEQLEIWGERNHVPVIAQSGRADSASVIYDAFQSAISRKINVLIADTAGRLHNQGNLMEELKKVRRVLQKLDASAPHEVMLIVDATNGQNALNQAQQFHQTIGLTGITVTKLDGTAKGGILFAVANKIGLPIRFIGVGEKVEDLRQFSATQFVDALFTEEE